MTSPFKTPSPNEAAGNLNLKKEDELEDNVIKIGIEPDSGKTPDHVRGTSDDTLAVDFADAEHAGVRFVSQWHRWHIWNGTTWEADNILRSYHLTRSFLRGVAKSVSRKLLEFKVAEIPMNLPATVRKDKIRTANAESRRAVKNILSARSINAISQLSRSDPRIASSVDDWDANQWLLNTPGGTVDLRTGESRKHNPIDHITMITAESPSHTAKPTIWLDFLKTIMRGDDEMVRYLQKVFGYCLVGETKEHQMYFAYGTGANGKGVTLNTIRSLLGGYGKEAAIETFIISDGVRHPTELADLRGARLVTCGETDDGQRWAEARIKMLTGGDPVKARFMRQDFFQYTPQFKLFLAGNHKPRLTNVDEAIERRFRLIPFTYTVPREQRDVDLFEKLKAEWPAILAWAIDGCLAWQTEGLAAPAAVATATKSYLSQEDALGAWFAECCVQSKDSFVYIKDLFDCWRSWAVENGETPGTKRTLTRHLEDREPILKIFKARRVDGFGFTGLELSRSQK